MTACNCNVVFVYLCYLRICYLLCITITQPFRVPRRRSQSSTQSKPRGRGQASTQPVAQSSSSQGATAVRSSQQFESAPTSQPWPVMRSPSYVYDASTGMYWKNKSLAYKKSPKPSAKRPLWKI